MSDVHDIGTERVPALRNTDLLPNMEYMEMLLKVADCVEGEDVFDRPVRQLLYDLCLARYYRDTVGKAALDLNIVPNGCYPGDTNASLWNDFIEIFPGLDRDEAKRVAHNIVYGWTLPVS